MSDIEREAFERWFRDNHEKDGVTVDLSKKAYMRAGWQAARQAPASGEPVAWVAPTSTGTFYGETVEAAVAEAESFSATVAGTIPLYDHPPAKVPEYDLVADYARCLEALGCKVDVGEELPICLGDMLDELLTTPTPATTPETEGYAKEKLTEALRQFRHNSDNTGSADKPEQGFVFGYDKAIVDDLVAMLVAAAGGNWIACTDRLPEPFRHSRTNKAGILIRFSNGRVSQFLDVGEQMISLMKNGPRKPLKFESPEPARITHWMPIPAPPKEQ